MKNTHFIVDYDCLRSNVRRNQFSLYLSFPKSGHKSKSSSSQKANNHNEIIKKINFTRKPRRKLWGRRKTQQRILNRQCKTLEEKKPKKSELFLFCVGFFLRCLKKMLIIFFFVIRCQSKTDKCLWFWFLKVIGILYTLNS